LAGELLKASAIDTLKAFKKRTFYLGKDKLCYIRKDGNV